METFPNPRLTSYVMEQAVHRMIVMDWLYEACETPTSVVELRPKRVRCSYRVRDFLVNVVLDLSRGRPKMVTAYITDDNQLVRSN
jgi:hypothetical protein